jgi:TetR/AcrR family transcriptional repressor of nem operon
MMLIMIGMKVDRQTHAAHGAAILDAASRLFRGRGIEAVRIADVSAAAGLTHGAFYGHFPSKASLAEAACRDGLARGADRWRRRAARARAEGADPLAAIIDSYLTEQHRDAPEGGCVLAALGAETSRAEAPLRAAMADGAALLLDVLNEEIAARHPDWPARQVSRAATAVMAALLGGLLLSRSCAADPQRSRDALAEAATLARAAADLPGKD